MITLWVCSLDREAAALRWRATQGLYPYDAAEALARLTKLLGAGELGGDGMVELQPLAS
jgi:hypothetical protein